MADRCEHCGAVLALVGRVHNCRPRPQPVTENPPNVTINAKRGRGRPSTGKAVPAAERMKRMRAKKRAG